MGAILDGLLDNPQENDPRPPVPRPLPPPFKVQWNNQIVKTQPVWVWDPYIPRGMLTMVTGEPSAGKTTLLCEIATAVALGRPLPGESTTGPPRRPQRVWILTSEDPADEVIAWRLENQGLPADQMLVGITDEKAPINAATLQWMKEFVISHDIGLVIIDTLTTWLGGEVDMNKANEAMDWMYGLRKLAKDTKCAVVTVRHKRKSNGGDNKLHAGMGSMGFTGAVRSELTVECNTVGVRTVERTKGNIGPSPPTLLYTIERHPDPENKHGILTWRGEVPPKEVSGSKNPSRVPRMLAMTRHWLHDQLKDGPRLASELIGAANKERISESTLRRAKVGYVTVYKSGEQWYWVLNQQPVHDDPPEAPATDHPETVGGL